MENNFKNISKPDVNKLKWLLEDVNNDRIKYILKILFENVFKEQIEANMINKLIELLEEFSDILSSQNNSCYLIKIGAFNILLGIILNSKNESIIKKVCILWVDISLNNILIQNELINIGVLSLLNFFKNNSDLDTKLVEHLIKLLSSVCKGNNLYPKRKLFWNNGVNTIFSLLTTYNLNTNSLNKILNLLIDLIENDDLYKYDIETKDEYKYNSKVKTKFIDYFITKYLYKRQSPLFEFINKLFNDNISNSVTENYLNLIILFIKCLKDSNKDLNIELKEKFISNLIKLNQHKNNVDLSVIFNNILELLI